jgi:hypothetical protein
VAPFGPAAGGSTAVRNHARPPTHPNPGRSRGSKVLPTRSRHRPATCLAQPSGREPTG